MDIFSSIKNVHTPLTGQSAKNSNILKNAGYTNKTTVQKNNEISKTESNHKSVKEIKKELQKVVEDLNRAMNPLNTDLQFKFNNKIEELTVQVVDKKNNCVIREFPPKDALKLMEKMRELVGMLFDKKG